VNTLNEDELAKLRSEHFGFIFQRYHLLPSLTALSNVETPAIYSGTPLHIRHEKAKLLLERLGLKDKLYHYPNQLSGGQQQRVSVARALMNGGNIILADEPTGALDSHSGEQVMKLLKELNNEGHTIIIVTHDKNVAIHAKRIIEIKDGEILSDKPNTEVNTENVVEKQKIKEVNFGSVVSHYANINQFVEAFKMALNAVLTHKMRSFLTMLGIIIGIASVVSVVALGNGSTQKIISDINSMGTNTIDIYPGKGFGDKKASQIHTLSEKDVNLLSNQSYVDSVSPNVGSTQYITYKNQSLTAQISGVGESYFQVKDIDFAKGHGFNDVAIKKQMQLAVIDNNTKKKLFADDDNPLGKVILINFIPCKIIGVTKEKQTAFGVNDNLNIWVPYSTAMTRLQHINYFNSITVRVKDDVPTDIAENGITELLTMTHRSKDFFTINTDSIKATIEKTTATMTLLISAIAIISLIVGGIGVMNIMLVSVTERTKEIGVRIAIGARQIDILQQFLIEAVLVCLMGGSIGVLLSLLIASIFNHFSTNFLMSYSMSSILLAFLCSTLIGIIFGFLPAKNAAKLDPIIALSVE
jgi:macrolide transport system ATP-binding/permease protein